MYLFKYYRPDFYFEKAIRYNELYFSSHAQLNDPNDLIVNYIFEDNWMRWMALFGKHCEYGLEDIGLVLNVSKGKAAEDLNSLFKGREIKPDVGDLNRLFDENSSQIRKIIADNLLPEKQLPIDKIDPSKPHLQQFVSLCEYSIKERIFQAFIPKTYSVSFSEEPLQPMMWAHYADGFKGCVVIYKANHNTQRDIPRYEISLRDHIMSKDKFHFPLDKVEYNNNDRTVPLLATLFGIGDGSKVLLSTKNKFWDYESEWRMRVSEQYSGIGTAEYVENILNKSNGHIFYHDNDTICGVIFGPRFDRFKRGEVVDTILGNRRYQGSSACYFFDTELTSYGKVKVVNGTTSFPMNGVQLHERPLEDRLELALAEFNLKND